MKPQSAIWWLDGLDPAPHPLAMATSDKAPKNPAAIREAKLAQALRANLRRRKAGGAPSAIESKGEADKGD